MRTDSVDLGSDGISFLSVEDVIAIHENQIEMYSPGESLAIRDLGLLEPAVMAVQQTFDGEYLYGSLPDMAAAYLAGIARNHAFDNGYKRAAFAATSVFLRFNRPTAYAYAGRCSQLGSGRHFAQD